MRFGQKRRRLTHTWRVWGGAQGDRSGVQAAQRRGGGDGGGGGGGGRSRRREGGAGKTLPFA